MKTKQRTLREPHKQRKFALQRFGLAAFFFFVNLSGLAVAFFLLTEEPLAYLVWAPIFAGFLSPMIALAYVRLSPFFASQSGTRDFLKHPLDE